jgi:hypothetical protein
MWACALSYALRFVAAFAVPMVDDAAWLNDVSVPAMESR